MNVGLDIDGVLYDFDRQAREVLQLVDLPEPLTQTQIEDLDPPASHWNRMEEIVGKRNWDWFWERCHETGAYRGGFTYIENWYVAIDLALRHEVYLITSRPRSTRHQTLEWLVNHGAEHEIAGVIHSQDKLKTLRGLDIAVMAEDRPSELRRLVVAGGLIVYGVRRSWNQELQQVDLNIRWVDDLTEMVKEEQTWPS